MTFDADTAKKLYQAICEDAADQKLQKYNLTNALKDPEETGEYSSASLSMDFYHVSADWKNVYDRLDDYYTNIGRICGNHPDHMADQHMSASGKTVPIS